MYSPEKFQDALGHSYNLLCYLDKAKMKILNFLPGLIASEKIYRSEFKK